MPPCCWPSTSIGLRMRPQSSTATWRIGTTRPVSMSTSTTATCAPNGNVAPAWREVELDRERAPVVAGLGRDLGPRERASPARRPRRAAVVGDDDVVGRRLEQLGGELAGPVEHASAASATALPAELQRTRPAGAAAARHQRGVGLHEADPARAGCPARPTRSWRTTWRDPGRAPTCRPAWSRCRRRCTSTEAYSLARPPAVISTYAATPMPSCHVAARAPRRPARRAASS